MTLKNCLSPSSDQKSCYLRIRIQPGAKQSKILGLFDADQLKVQIKAPPIDGKANEMLLKFLKDSLSLKGNEIEIVKGLKSRSKILEISRSLEWVNEKLAALWKE